MVRKTFRINEKTLAAKHNRRLFWFNLPSLCVMVSAFAVVIIFVVLLSAEPPAMLYRAIFYSSYAAIAYSFIVCLIGSLISGARITGHKANTYIEISDAVMVISQHNQTRVQQGEAVYYKKMWIVNLRDIEEVIYMRERIIIISKARYFNQNSDWLRYSCTEDGIDFAHWWYDDNGGEDVTKIEINDFYTRGERIAKRIAICSGKIKERESRREAFRREMLETASKAVKRNRISDKYVQKNTRVFRP